MKTEKRYLVVHCYEAEPRLVIHLPIGMPIWLDQRLLLRALDPVMQHYGMRKVDITSFTTFDEDTDAYTRDMFNRCMEGGREHCVLYDFWDYREDKFVLVREKVIS